LVARTSLACVWIYEGLMPKLLFPQASRAFLVHSGLYVISPEFTLVSFGVAEIIFGLLMLTGRFELWLIALSSLGVVTLGGMAAILQPESMADPAGGFSKNLALLGCAAVVWLLAPIDGANAAISRSKSRNA
jgi:uncharacterized membrane protein YphA (DoxX/SURF4 family)